MRDVVHIVHPEGFQATINRERINDDEPQAQTLFDEWNHGSGRESTEFLEAEVRSLSVGDFVGINGTYWQVLPSGFEMVKLKYVNRILKEVRTNLLEKDPFGSRVSRKSLWAASREYRDSVQFGTRTA
jgi:hypothetical protein